MVRKTNACDINTMRKIISYDSQTGKFFWLPRNASMFATPKAFKAWKSKFEGTEAFSVDDGQGYRRARIFGTNYRAHRVAWALYYNEWPAYEIDHINGDKSDNRIENLRSVNHMENCRNLKKNTNNTSGVTGVSWVEERQKWQAYIDDNVGRIPLGRYDEFYQAVIARKAAEKALRYHPNHGKD